MYSLMIILQHAKINPFTEKKVWEFEQSHSNSLDAASAIFFKENPPVFQKYWMWLFNYDHELCILQIYHNIPVINAIMSLSKNGTSKVLVLFIDDVIIFKFNCRLGAIFPKKK